MTQMIQSAAGRENVWKIADQKHIPSDDIIFEDDIDLDEDPSPRVQQV